MRSSYVFPNSRHWSLGLLAAAALGLCAGNVHAQSLVYGIDVSHWQGTTINWTSVKNAGYQFAFAKATEGVDFNDDTFSANMANAPAAGVYIGPYHFATLGFGYDNPNDAVDEANDFVDRILQVAPTYAQVPGMYLRPVLDLETLRYADTGANIAANKAYASKWIRDFAGRVQTRLGVTPIVYSNTYYATTFFESNISQYPFWMANYNYTPPTLPPSSADGIFNGWDFWQYTDDGAVSGVPGADVDKDVYQGTLTQLLAEFQMVQPKGDFDLSTKVDGKDFLAWQRNLGVTGTSATFAKGDADGNRNINAADLTVWQTQFGSVTVSSPAFAAVPEPAAASLALFGILAAARRRRHTGAAL